jgi:hypothetical protein
MTIPQIDPVERDIASGHRVSIFMISAARVGHHRPDSDHSDWPALLPRN